MSKYLSFPEVLFADRRLLLAALADIGYRDVEEGEGLTKVVKVRPEVDFRRLEEVLVVLTPTPIHQAEGGHE